MSKFISRVLNLAEITAKKSVFLFGPRQTGKSSLIRETLPKGTPIINLLNPGTRQKYLIAPSLLIEELAAAEISSGLVVIDEVQRVPELLDVVHLLIEERGLRFLLTGSSARKLRRAGVNLLGGRARTRNLHPFVYPELKGENFNIWRALSFGMIPSIVTSDNPSDDLANYIGTYLEQEIATEALVRNIPAFSRFFEIAGIESGNIINQTKISSDAAVKRTTVQEYISILKETFIASDLPVWKKGRKAKTVETSKLYLFDLGVVRALRLQKKEIDQNSADVGYMFEHFIHQEIRAWIDYRSPLTHLAYWRTADGRFEVDFIVGDNLAIEVKASKRVNSTDLRGLKAIANEAPFKFRIVVCFETTSRIVDGVLIMPWFEFLDKLWADNFMD